MQYQCTHTHTHKQKYVHRGACARAHTGTNAHTHTYMHMSLWRAGVCWFLWNWEGEIRMGRGFHGRSRREPHDSTVRGGGAEQTPGGPVVNEWQRCFVCVETFFTVCLRWVTMMSPKSLPACSLELPYGLLSCSLPSWLVTETVISYKLHWMP